MSTSGSTAKAAQAGPTSSPSTRPSPRASSPSHTTSRSRRMLSSLGGSPVHTGSSPAVPVSGALPVSMAPAYVGETESMTPTTETMVGIGGAPASTHMGPNIAPQPPPTHGVLRLGLVLEGERIQHAERVIGYMPRGAEKLFGARDSRQIIMLANRHDWLSA